MALSTSLAEGQKGIWASPHPLLGAECLTPRRVAFQKGWIFLHPLKTMEVKQTKQPSRRWEGGFPLGWLLERCLLIASLLNIHKEIQFHKLKGTERDSFFIWGLANSNYNIKVRRVNLSNSASSIEWRQIISQVNFISAIHILFYFLPGFVP